MDYDYEIEKRYHPENMLPVYMFDNLNEELELEDDEQDEKESEE